MAHSRRTLSRTAALVILAGAWCSAEDLTGPMTFVAITPCRILDTRGGDFTGQAGPPALSAGAPRTFQITGIVPGVPSQCGVPTSARGVSINFTVTAFTGAGNLRAFPAGGVLPNASIVNYALENIANATSIPLGPLPAGTESGITVQADVSGTHFIADVSGYYMAETVFASGQIREDATIRSASSRVSSVSHPTTGQYCIAFTAAPTTVQLETSLVGLSGGATTALFPRVSNGQGGSAPCPAGQLDIRLVDGAGVPTDGRFSFIVP